MSSAEASPEASSHRSSSTGHSRGNLGFFLCWAVVFADIGTSIYYVPGILYGQVGKLAGFFVVLTMVVFVLLTLKYAEVTARYPQGGGVVTVASRTLKPWAGAFGGMLELGDYFLTAAISSLSGLTYFSVVAPDVGPVVLLSTIVVLILLGLLNWWGVSESATVSAIGAIIAFLSDLAILMTVFIQVPLSTLLNLIPQMFQGKHLTGLAILTGFAGSFLAFSGLESISQLSPVMKIPRKRTGRLALLLVVLTVGITSPLLTIFSTGLLDASKVDPNQFISHLGGEYGGKVLGIEVAISASALLIFASNTAIIGCYHVFLALSRMKFFPAFVQRRNRWRGTPHYAIAFATGIPIAVLLLVNGNIEILGDMYAFGLLGAFSLTCLGIDVVRLRERRQYQTRKKLKQHLMLAGNKPDVEKGLHPVIPQPQRLSGIPAPTWMLILGMLTTGLVVLAWSTNLVFKPLATAFGGTITTVGLTTAYWNYRSQAKRGRRMAFPQEIRRAIPGSILAVLPFEPEKREAVILSACREAQNDVVVFLYRGATQPMHPPRMFENADPYLHDDAAQHAFSESATIAREHGVKSLYVYLPNSPDVVLNLWQLLRPRDTILVDRDSHLAHSLAPDLVRLNAVPGGQVTHYIKNWLSPVPMDT